MVSRTLLLGGSGDLELPEQGLRAARLKAIKDHILGKIAQHDLSLGDVARSQQISESYIRQLLAETGTTFTDFVLGGRLARAHRMLLDPHYLDRSISAVAYEAGFGDLSYFNRTFRRRYGATPSDIRTDRATPEGRVVSRFRGWIYASDFRVASVRAAITSASTNSAEASRNGAPASPAAPARR